MSTGCLQRIACFVLFGALLVVILITMGEASSERKLTVRDLVCQADVIVYGIVHNQYREGDFQLSAIAPLNILKAPERSTPSTIIVRSSAYLFGGHPEYQLDQELIVFLEAIPGSSQYRTVGVSQGKFEVKNKRVLRPDLPVEEFLAQIEEHNCEPRKP